MISRKSLLPLFAVPLLVVTTGAARAAVTLVEKDDWKFSVVGIVETDIIADSTRSLVETIGNSAVGRGGTVAGDNGRTQFSLRNSRLGFELVAPKMDDWKSRAYIEFDFLGYDPSASGSFSQGQSEGNFLTSPTMRMRHAYIATQKDDFHLLVGQTWNLFGWDPFYTQTTASVNPAGATLYARTPQVTATQDIHLGERNYVQAALSMSRPVERDGEAPNMDAGLRFVFADMKAGLATGNSERKLQPASLAFSGTFRDITAPNSTVSNGGSTDYFGYGGAAQFTLPILAAPSDATEPANTLMLMGETTIGTGYGDEFNGWSGNTPSLFNGTAVTNSSVASSMVPNLDSGIGGFDANGAFHLIHLETVNLELQYHLPEGWKSYTTIGASRLFSNNVSNLVAAANSVIYNTTETFFVNYFHDFTPHVRAGIEALQYRVTYADGFIAKDDRLQASAYFFF